MARLLDIEGIGPVRARKLKKARVASTQDLLKQGATPAGRKEVAARSGFTNKEILEWVNRADLFRIKGVAAQYSDLLETAGVDTVVELAKRKAVILHGKMVDVNEKKHLVRRPPSLKEVQRWISQAKRLPRVVKY
jgi:predicted flap endonuclease-1-like 5' DNA nuclease